MRRKQTGVQCEDDESGGFRCGPCPAELVGNGIDCRRSLCLPNPCHPGTTRSVFISSPLLTTRLRSKNLFFIQELRATISKTDTNVVLVPRVSPATVKNVTNYVRPILALRVKF